MEYYSAFKKNEIMPFAARWMDAVVGIFSEVSQTEVKVAQSCLFVTPWTIQSMEFSGPEYWSG